MTQISIRKTDLNLILKEAINKVEGIKTLKTPYNQEQIAKAVFTIAGTAFIRNTNMTASSQRLRFHHMYEWGAVGNNNKRLFTIVRTAVRGGNLKISSNFLDSRSSVPVRTTGSKKTSKSHVFKKKATVMELGRPVVIVPKNGKMLVFPNKNGKLIFTKKSYVRNPGGNAVKGSFNTHMKNWFSNPQNITSAVYSSGMMKDLELEMARALSKTGAGVTQANSVIRSISTKYSGGKTIL